MHLNKENIGEKDYTHMKTIFKSFKEKIDLFKQIGKHNSFYDSIYQSTLQNLTVADWGMIKLFLKQD